MRQGNALRFEQKTDTDGFVGPEWLLPRPRVGRHVSVKLADITRKDGNDDCVGLFIQSYSNNQGAMLACLSSTHAIFFRLTEKKEWNELSRAPLPGSFNAKTGGWLSVASTRRGYVMLLDGLPVGQADRPSGFQDGWANVYAAGAGTGVTVQDFQAAEL